VKKWFAFLLMSLLGLAIVVPNAFLSTKNGSSSVVQVENNGEDSQILKDDVIIPDAEKVSLPTASFPGAGTQADPYVLSTASHLAYLSTNYSYANGTKYFELGADIVLNDGYFEDDGTYHDGGDGKLYKWSGIKTYYFQNDHFDGKGHSIIGIYNDSLFTDGYVPGNGWRYLENCTFKNFSVKNAYVNYSEKTYGTLGAGIIFSGEIRNSVFENISCYGKFMRTTSVSSASAATGGIFGYLANDLTIKNCSNYASVVASNCDYVGGVAGYAYKGDFSQCCNFGDITGKQFCGGIAGYGRMNFLNCKNEGRIEGICFEGGIVGCDIQDNWVLSNCENFGDIIGSNSSGGVGGIIGNMTGAISVLNCRNYGSVVGNEVGGISGKIEAGTILIEGCKNFGSVDSCVSSMIGGIVGRIQGFNFKALVIKNCLNCANIKAVGKQNVGGIIGLMSSSVNDTSFIIEGCENRGDIAGGEGIGGIFGRIEISSCDYNIINCKNSGLLSGSSKIGGIVGNIYGTTSGLYAVFIDSCKNTGDIVCSGVAAGICGSTERNPYFSGNSVINVLNCENYGNIKSSSSPTAGIIYAGPSKGVITRCINKGTITASYYACGIFYGSNFKVSYCWNDGKCVGSSGSSGIGAISGGTTISCCLCTGNKDISVGASGIYNCISISTKKYYGDDFSAFFMDPVTGKIGLKAVQSVGQFQPTLTLENLTQLSFTKVA